MKTKVAHIIFIILLSSSYIAIGQQNEIPDHFYGRMLVEKSIECVPFAQVINLRTNRGVFTDSTGYFNISVIIGDTLLISALGYENVHYPIKASSFHDFSEWIFMKKTSYELKEAKIIYLGDYRDFKYKVLALELPDNEIKINQHMYNSLPHNYTKPEPSINVGSPISLLYYWLSDEGKEIRSYKKAKVESRKHISIAEKYNPKVVEDITGLKGEKLYKFIEFCNFSDSYLVEVLEIDLYEAIIKKLEEFLKINKE